MFHTCITASSGRQIDIDRAMFLMDKTLKEQAYEETCENPMKNLKKQPAGQDYHSHRIDLVEWLPQWFWSRYCELHHEKYNEPFEPDISRTWG